MARLKPLFVTFATIFALFAVSACGPTGKFKQPITKDDTPVLFPKAEEGVVKNYRVVIPEDMSIDPSEHCLTISEEIKKLGGNHCALTFTTDGELFAGNGEDNLGEITIADSSSEPKAKLTKEELIVGDRWQVAKEHLYYTEDFKLEKRVEYFLIIEILDVAENVLELAYAVEGVRVTKPKKQKDNASEGSSENDSQSAGGDQEGQSGGQE